MLCPCLSSTVVSFWLLIACTYNTLTKKKVSVFLYKLSCRTFWYCPAPWAHFGAQRNTRVTIITTNVPQPQNSLCKQPYCWVSSLKIGASIIKEKIPKMDVGVTLSFKTQAVCGHTKESMAVTEDTVRADLVHAQTFSCPECRRWQWRSVSSLSAPSSSFHPCQEQIVTSG